MRTKPLGTVAKIIAGQSPASSTYNSTGDGLPFFQGKTDFQEMYPKVRMWCTSAKRKEAEPGDILISVRAPVGAVNICDQKSIIGRGLSAIRSSPSIYALFLYYFLKANERQIDALGTGSTFKAITQETLKKIEIPLPPLDDQKRIAHLLGKVEGLIARRKQHLQQLDDLLKSVFLEKFGDPVRNEKGWDIHSVNDFSDSRLGKMRDKKFITGNHLRKYLGNSNVQWFRFVFDELLEMDFDEREREIFKLEHGDLLVCEGGDIGRCAIWKNQLEDCYFQKALHRVRLNRSKAIPEYIQYVFLFYSLFNGFKITSKATIAHLTGEKLKATLIPLPPIDLQNQFATIVEKVEHLKFRYQQSLSDLENLCGALSQKAFKGELDLSRVVLSVVSTTEDTDGTETHQEIKPLPKGFARQLLAAEILQRHNSHDMTQMKLQKLIHLTEYHARLDEIRGEYQRQAAGPFDNKMMYGIAAGLKKQQWFVMSGRGQNAKYSSLPKAGSHEKYLVYWRKEMTKIDEVLALLGHVSPDRCEIVSTLYAAWNDLLIDGVEVTDERIIEQASKAELWHKTKEAIDPERWPKALQWMRDHDLVPTGYGKHTRKLQ